MEAHPDLAWIKGRKVRIAFLASDRIKKSHGRPVLGECVKVGGIYKALLPYDFLIVIYEVNTASFYVPFAPTAWAAGYFGTPPARIPVRIRETAITRRKACFC